MLPKNPPYGRSRDFDSSKTKESRKTSTRELSSIAIRPYFFKHSLCVCFYLFRRPTRPRSILNVFRFKSKRLIVRVESTLDYSSIDIVDRTG